MEVAGRGRGGGSTHTPPSISTDCSSNLTPFGVENLYHIKIDFGLSLAGTRAGCGTVG